MMNISKKHFLQKVAKGTKSLRLVRTKFSSGAVFAFDDEIPTSLRALLFNPTPNREP
jgi:hypothetical protein